MVFYFLETLSGKGQRFSTTFFTRGRDCSFLIAVPCDVAPCTLFFAICAGRRTLRANFSNLCVVDTLCTLFFAIFVLRSLLARTFLQFVRDGTPCSQIFAICVGWTYLTRKFSQFVRGRHTLHAIFYDL